MGQIRAGKEETMIYRNRFVQKSTFAADATSAGCPFMNAAFAQAIAWVRQNEAPLCCLYNSVRSGVRLLCRG